MRYLCWTVVLCILATWTSEHARGEDSVDELLTKATQAQKEGQPEEAIRLATQAMAKAPGRARPIMARGTLYESQRKHEEAVADFTQVLKIAPQAAEAYDHRGSERFKLGQIQESIDDFNLYIKARPDAEPGHWKRGISYYYAKQYDLGRKQFEGYQTVDDNDVENAVWRYLCTARVDGVEKARAELLKIKDDRRVPMMQVYAMFQGELQPEEVLAAAEAGDPTELERTERLFYAHLYLGLFFDAAGNVEQAQEHIFQAEKLQIAHYMWDVAKVHADQLREATAPK